MTPLRTVLVGFGKVADTLRHDARMTRYFPDASHAQVLKRHPAFDWVAVVDPSEDARRRARTDWGIGICTADISELPDPAQFTAAVIATPPGQRRRVLAGLPGLRAVLIEKPVGGSAAEAADLVAECRRRDIALQVNYWRRGDETFSSLRSRIIPLQLGTMQAAFGLYGNGLRNNGSHLIDLARLALGEVSWVEALSEPRPVDGPIAGDIHTPFAMALEGCIACLQPISFNHYREVGLDLWGTAGRIQIVQEGLVTMLSRKQDHRGLEGAAEIACDDHHTLPLTVGRALYRIYDNLAAAVREGTSLVSSGESALKTEAVVDAVISSAQDGCRRVRLPW